MNITGDSLSGGMYDLLDSTMAVSGSGSSSAISDEIFQSIMADPITNFLENTSSYHPTNYDGGSLGFNAHEDLISHLSANDHSTTSVQNENNNSGFTIGGYDDVLANLLDMDGTGGRNSLTTSLSSIPSPPSSPPSTSTGLLLVSPRGGQDDGRDCGTSPLKRSSEGIRNGQRSPKAPKLWKGNMPPEPLKPIKRTGSRSPSPSPATSPKSKRKVPSPESNHPPLPPSATTPTNSRKPAVPGLPVSLGRLREMNDPHPVSLPSKPLSPRRTTMKSPRSPRDSGNNIPNGASPRTPAVPTTTATTAITPQLSPAGPPGLISAVQETISKLDQTTRNIMKESLERLAKKAESQSSSACCSEVNSPRSPAPSSLISPRESTMYSLSDSLRDLSERGRSPAPHDFESLEQKVINLFLNVNSPANSPRGSSTNSPRDSFDATPLVSPVASAMSIPTNNIPLNMSTNNLPTLAMPHQNGNTTYVNNNNNPNNNNSSSSIHNANFNYIPSGTTFAATNNPPNNKHLNNNNNNNSNPNSNNNNSNSVNNNINNPSSIFTFSSGELNASMVPPSATNGTVYTQVHSPGSTQMPTSPPLTAPIAMMLPIKQQGGQQQQQQSSQPGGQAQQQSQQQCPNGQAIPTSQMQPTAYIAAPGVEGIPTTYVFAAPAATYVNASPWWAVNIGGGQQRLINSSLYPYMINNRTVLLPNTAIDQNAQNVYLASPQFTTGAPTTNGVPPRAGSPLTTYYTAGAAAAPQASVKPPTSPSTKARKRSTSGTSGTRRRRSLSTKTEGDSDLTSSTESIPSPRNSFSNSTTTPSPPPTNLSSVLLSPTTTPPPDMTSLRLTNDLDYLPPGGVISGDGMGMGMQVFGLSEDPLSNNYSMMEAMEGVHSGGHGGLNNGIGGKDINMMTMGSNPLDMLIVDGYITAPTEEIL